MKNLLNNFTTPEQSKRLLELGVPADSADCFYSWWRGDICADEPLGPLIRGTVSVIDYQNDIPCWSVGRLMEIAHICSGSTLSYKEEVEELEKFKEEHKCETLIETVILCIKDAVSIGRLDFSKL